MSGRFTDSRESLKNWLVQGAEGEARVSAGGDRFGHKLGVVGPASSL